MSLELLDQLLVDCSAQYEQLDADQRREFAAGLLSFADALHANEGMSEPERVSFSQQNIPYELSIFPVRPDALDKQRLAAYCGLLPYIRELRRYACIT
jgi:hypothetical protein